MGFMSTKVSKTSLWCIILFTVTLILYSNTLNNKFAFDDKSLIVENRFLHEHTSLKTIFSTNYRYGVGFIEEGLYRPLVILSYMINSTKGLNPRPFHFFNITINAFNSSLLFLLLFFLLGDVYISLFAAVIFSFHPIHTEAVANVAGRPEIMCTFFVLLSWILFEIKGKHIYTRLFGSIFFLAAMLSKETAIIFPLMVLGTDLFLKRHIKKKHMIMKYTLLIVTLLFYGALRWYILGETSTGNMPSFVNNPLVYTSSIVRIITALSIFLKYILLLLFPYTLSADYSYNQLQIYKSILHVIPIISIVLFSTFFVISVYYRKRYPQYGIAWIIFFFPYLLISNIIFPIGTIMGERLMYLPSAGFSLVMGTVLAKLMKKWQPGIIALLIAIVLLYTVKTISRNHEWYDDFTLFTANLETAPNSVKVLCNMGYLSGTKGMLNMSESYYRKALEIYPEYDVALRGLGKNLYDRGRYKESAIYYAKAVDISPQDPLFHYDYGLVLEKIQRFDEAEKAFKESIKLAPANPLPYQGLGNIMLNKGNYRMALEYYDKAEKLGGDRQIILNNMAVASYFLEEYRNAFRYVQEAESLGFHINPDLVRSIKEKLTDH